MEAYLHASGALSKPVVPDKESVPVPAAAPDLPPGLSMKFCPECGTKFALQAKFCCECGHRRE